MDEKFPSVTFQNRMNSIKEDYKELGNLAIKLNGSVVKLLEKYDESIYDDIEKCSNIIDIKTIDLERECIRFLATEQPLAKDLMFIESTLRVISHFKRICHLFLKIAKSIKMTGWNTYRVEARGNRFTEYINDVKTSELVDERASSPKTGIFGLQIHPGPPMFFQYKNIFLKTY